MTVVPPGPDPAVVITDEIVEAAVAARARSLRNDDWNVMRVTLEAVADMIVASWQHAEEDLLQ